MQKVPQVGRVIVHSDLSKDLNGLLSSTLPLMYIFFVMFLFMTIAVSGSAVIISSLERDIEYATLDTLGVSKRRVAGAILIEMGILALMTSLVAIPLAYAMAGIMALILQAVVFYFPVVFVVWGTILTLLMGMAFIMISSLVPVRYMSRLDTERTIRERMVA
jgi:ABC-type antimicrobial peptide transport system permease subunit